MHKEKVMKTFATGGGVEALVIQGGVYPPLTGKYQQEMTAYQTLANQSYLKKGGSIKFPNVHNVPKLVNSNVGYAILDSDKELSGSTWSAGGCYALARAVQEVYGGKLVAIEDADGVMQHVMVQIGNKFVDSDGISGLEQKLKTQREDEMVNGPRLVDFDVKNIGSIGIGSEKTVEKLVTSLQKLEKQNFASGGKIIKINRSGVEPIWVSPPCETHLSRASYDREELAEALDEASNNEVIANIRILEAILESNYPPGFRRELNDQEEKFLEQIIGTYLSSGILKTKTQVESIAKNYGITSKNDVKELTELAIVTMARFIVTMNGTIEKKFNQIVSLYQTQVNLSHRTSTSVLLQQYSTPAPIGFLAGEYCKGNSETLEAKLYFEPSAGNGLLTIALPSENFVVNEIDETRNLHLQTQGYKAVLRMDASKPFTFFRKMFDGVITNPPFGALDGMPYGTINIKALDHLMALYALETMKDNGRAAIIIGGHTQYDSEGRIQAGKNRIFLSYLYKHFVVDDVINIDGALYSRMGTSFDVRLILISARKKTAEGFPPLKDNSLGATENQSAAAVTSFHQLYERISKIMEPHKTNRI